MSISIDGKRQPKLTPSGELFILPLAAIACHGSANHAIGHRTIALDVHSERALQRDSRNPYGDRSVE
jgi:hypothetical protein